MFVLNGMEVKRKKGLAACPLCNNEAVFVNYLGGVFIKCSCCECMVAKQISVTTETILPFKDEEEAIKVWNRRNGRTVEAKYMMDKATPQEVLAQRDMRVEKIVTALKLRKRATLTELADETGIKRSVINNTMAYIKKLYPQVKSKHGITGYWWED